MIRNASIALLGICLAASTLTACSSDDDSSPTPTTSRPTTTSAATTTTALDGTTLPTTTAAGSTSTAAPTTTTVKQTTVRVYLVRGEKVGPVRRPAARTTPARSAVEELLKGPSAADADAGLTSAIPKGTKLRSINIAAGTATVDLTTEFGSGGGSLSMQERVAQVVFTLTQFPTVKQVSFRMNGAPVEMLGGEGLIIDTPQTRANWEDMTPAILVESPLPGDTVKSPFTVSGTANTFEATYMVSLTDSKGKKVYENFGTATSGTGTRGTFSQTVKFSGAASGVGTLKVFESSAKDGSEINVVEMPVRL